MDSITISVEQHPGPVFHGSHFDGIGPITYNPDIHLA
jgi:hypothetical protein